MRHIVWQRVCLFVVSFLCFSGTLCAQSDSIVDFDVDGLGYDVTQGFDVSRCVLHVPEGMTRDFRTDDEYGRFGKIVEEPAVASGGL
ncbi:MAG: hypothetical protein K2N13_08950 [Paraprevotella sp.]|nr:hypothetical protein [Paraprevotella sp.]